MSTIIGAERAVVREALGRLPEESLSTEARDAPLAAFRGWSGEGGTGPA